MVPRRAGFRPRLVLLAVVIGSGCRLGGVRVPIDPEATFVAHREHQGIVVDHMKGGRPARLVAPGWLRLSGDPTFVLRADGTTLGTLSMPAPAMVEVRSAASRSAPLAGTVEPSWTDGAIRLALRPSGGPALRSDVFARVGGGGGTSALSRIAQTVLDLRGVYRADVRDASGATVGWLRVRISPYQPAPRIYDGALPESIDEGLAAAAAFALDSEVEWIEEHALDVYRGNRGGPLQQSVPLGGSR